MSIRLSRILGLGPRGDRGLAVAVAASRAGALGMLDLEGVGADSGLALIRRAAELSDRIGVRVEGGHVHDDWLARLPEVVAAICVVGDEDLAERAVARIKRSGRVTLFEATTREAASRLAAAGVDGLVLAGHEAGGRCADESSFILLQAVIADCGLPVWVRGGIGPHSAAGCVAAGAAGVVLDGALLLARESGLSEDVQATISRLDGSETVVVRLKDGLSIRVFAPVGSRVRTRLTEDASDLTIGWEPGQAWPLGQDAAFAAGLARKFVTTGGIVQAVEQAIDRGMELARSLRPLAPGSALAASHGTLYPIVQGPMTRVSDTAAFAGAVARGGGLPFLALAMLRGAEVKALLIDATRRLAGMPWGVGVLGFVPPELRREQLEEVRAARPPFALIAGGRPDQAAELEREGIATYLHVPSPGLLNRYLRDGARRFVVEGRECGGHVGPRSSLVLWEQAVGVLGEFLDEGHAAELIHVLFAGGIHDARSMAAVAAISAPLAARGVKLGVLVGTAYLFTEEAVTTGAIVPRFQAEAMKCRRTVLLETGPGHEVRVGPSPFVEAFETTRKNLIAGGKPAESVRTELERLNAGRLRVAAKGVDRADKAGSPLIDVAEPVQFERGIYMLGQVAALRERITTIAELHEDMSVGGSALLDRDEELREGEATTPAKPSDIAIVGVSAIFPGAADARTFWENTLKGLDAIIEVPPDRWDWRLYYDADPKAPDKVVSKWGGFVPDVAFDPLRYGMPPTSLPSIEPVQLLVLQAVRDALDDAGYAERSFPKERTAVALGMGGGSAQLAMGYAFRSYLPMLESIAPEAGRIAREAAAPFLPEWTEDSFPGFLLNVAAGRVANRFDLGGSNYTVDAACGSSLAAASLAVRELETGAADMVILGGADTVQNPLTYLAFSKTHAFSPRGRCRPFDATADGIVISEGVGVVILKRLVDAERDGDRIYAVIKGMGTSSDGRARGLTAPNAEGQARALERAYAKAGIDPRTVGYVEAHGTGTAVGDVVELNALSGVLRKAGAEPASCAVGSVKSMIGHTKCAAGIAGLINAAMALHHRVLPPTIGVDRLNPKADLTDGPLHVSTRPRPWFHADRDRPRRASVSAFGFGGTNFHAVLEGYDRDLLPPAAPSNEWPAELFLWRSDEPRDINSALERLERSFADGARPRLRDLARTLAERFDGPGSRPTLAIVASTLDDLRSKLASVRSALANDQAEFNDPRGVYYAARPEFSGSQVAFLFPGQGSQALEMVGDLAFAFHEVRCAFEAFDTALASEGRPPVSSRVFPPTSLDDAARERARLALTATEVAQPAVGAASVGLLRLLESLGITPDAVAGHSYGELVALHAAGCLTVEGLAILSDVRGRLMKEAAGANPCAMAAIAAGPDRVRELIAGERGVVVANLNGPRQTVVSGSRDGVNRTLDRARADGLRAFALPVACAFHSPSVAAASNPLASRVRGLLQGPPDRPVIANLDAAPHPADTAAIAERLGEHLASPVRFTETIETLYKNGSRVFVEVGPGSVLSPMVGAILDGRPHLAVSCDAPERPGIPTLLQALARLAVAGVAIRPVRLTVDRDARRLDLDQLPHGDGTPPLSASTWLVNGSRARPIAGPEPLRLGQAISDPVPQASPERNGHHNGVMTNGKHSPRFSPMPDTHAKPNGAPKPAAAAEQNGHVPNVTPLDTGPARVMETFQATMRTFLEVQQATMLAYLSRRGSEALLPPVGSAVRTESHQGEKNGSAGPPPFLAPVSVMNGETSSLLNAVPPPAPVVENEPVCDSPIPMPESRQSDRETISDRLISIVKDRTGYPAEMLKPDLDLEADLGIDSIKRIEILGTLRESVDGLNAASDSPLMDALARARTLGEIVERISTALGARPAEEKHVPDTTPSQGEVNQNIPATESSDAPVRRLVLEAVSSPLRTKSDGLAPGGVVVVTDDGRGIAQTLRQVLNADGHEVEIVGPDRVDQTSPAAVERLLNHIRDHAPIVGIIHASPLRPIDADLCRAAAEVKGLFLLAKAAAGDLESASRRGGACLVAATAMGGAFASAGTAPRDFLPSQGGIAGLVKTLAREWPEIRVRVIDLDPTESTATIAKLLAAEALTDDGWPEVGHFGGRRIRLRAVPASLGREGGTFHLSPGEPVLVTGGARGITAAVSLELARRWRPTLLLLGSSPVPETTESPATASLNRPADLKAALYDRLRRAGREIAPAEVELAYRTLVSGREIQATLQTLRAAGSTVDYARVDIRDAQALAHALKGWRKHFGEPVGLIHGAGVIQDRLIRDKSPESFDRVLGTKLDGALNLVQLLQGDRLRFTAMFSSIAGRFGNRGQGDYAAANDALNKLSLWLDRRWPGRVVSINWGPWSNVGMVSELEGRLSRRGLGLIRPRIGAAAFADELMLGRKGDVEVIIAGALGQLDEPLRFRKKLAGVAR
jgi:acyl transferase domain-containing protein/NAD(P)H-dependent flavin oxidoreductase YrpB (nitropropane dioxygenase family)/NAD(P)-dependent dehydrogenase (short-subunit alcohol dehydrogenase family)